MGGRLIGVLLYLLTMVNTKETCHCDLTVLCSAAVGISQYVLCVLKGYLLERLNPLRGRLNIIFLFGLQTHCLQIMNKATAMTMRNYNIFTNTHL